MRHGHGSGHMPVVATGGAVFSLSGLPGAAFRYTAGAGASLTNGLVQTWTDQFSVAGDATEGTSSLRPTHSDTSWDGSNPSLDFDGSGDKLELASWAPTGITELSLHFALDVHSLIGVRAVFSGAPTVGNRLILAIFGSNWQVYDGAWHSFGAASTGRHIVQANLITGAGASEIWVDNVSLGTSTVTVPGSFTTTRLCSDSPTAGFFFDGDVAEAVGYTADQSGQQENIYSDIVGRYPL